MKHFTPSRRVSPAPATPSRSTVATKLRAFQAAFHVLYALNLAGLGAALWLNAPDAALLFVIGMFGAAIAMIATAVVQGRG